MGVDLKILPESFENTSFNIMMFSRDSVLWGAIEKSGIEIETREPISCYLARNKSGEVTFGEATNDAYGGKITYSTASELHQVMSGVELSGDNIWICAALKAMRSDHKVFFYLD